jgi:hypothetical protein
MSRRRDPRTCSSTMVLRRALSRGVVMPSDRRCSMALVGVQWTMPLRLGPRFTTECFDYSLGWPHRLLETVGRSFHAVRILFKCPIYPEPPGDRCCALPPSAFLNCPVWPWRGVWVEWALSGECTSGCTKGSDWTTWIILIYFLIYKSRKAIRARMSSGSGLGLIVDLGTRLLPSQAWI